MKKTKKEIVDMLQIAEYERDEYWELIVRNIAPSLNINQDELNGLSIDSYDTVICKKINDIVKENESLKKENERLQTELNEFISDDDGEDIEFTDDESESDISEHSSDREFIDDD